MKTGIFVCGRDINLPLPEWERLMWGEPPNKMGSLPMAIKIFSAEENLDIANRWLIVLGNGCIPRKNDQKEIGFIKKYFRKNFSKLDKFKSLQCYNKLLFTISKLIDIVEIGCIVNNTAEEIVEAAHLFEEAGINRIFMVSCGSQIARAMMAQMVAKEQGLIPSSQQWFFVADDMFYTDATAADVVVVQPPHRTDDPSLHAPVKMHELMKKFFKFPWQKRAKLLPKLDALLKTFGV